MPDYAGTGQECMSVSPAVLAAPCSLAFLESPARRHAPAMLRLLRPVAATTGAATKGRLWDWVPASLERLELAERRILSRTLPVPFEMTKVAQLGTVVVPCSDQARADRAPNLVMIHGFAGGNAVWAMNLAELSKHFNVYAVEWIGVGRSDRPDFEHNDFDSANEFVVSAFENWRKQMNLEQFDLCAHSMGAIFASSYAIEHPDAVKHLVLVSPAGVPHPPPPPKPDSEEARARNRSWLRRFAFYMWENGVTPMSIARFVGPYGPQLVSNILHKRISFMPANSAMRDGSLDLNDLSEYLYHNWALKPSGERTMTTHLAPGAHAVRPLIDTLSPEVIKMPLTFIYGGGSDWMDYRHGLKVVEKFERKGKNAELFLVPNAGHQVFLDNPNGFNRVLVDCLSSKPGAVDTTVTL